MSYLDKNQLNGSLQCTLATVKANWILSCVSENEVVKSREVNLLLSDIFEATFGVLRSVWGSPVQESLLNIEVTWVKAATKKSVCAYDVLHLVSVCGAAGILNILFIKYTSCTDTDKAGYLDLLQKFCSSVYSSNLNNSDSKYMCGIVCSIPTVYIVYLSSICRWSQSCVDFHLFDRCEIQKS